MATLLVFDKYNNKHTHTNLGGDAITINGRTIRGVTKLILAPNSHLNEDWLLKALTNWFK